MDNGASRRRSSSASPLLNNCATCSLSASACGRVRLVAPQFLQATTSLRPITTSCPCAPTPLTTTSVYADIAWDVVFAAPNIRFELHEHHPSQNSSDRHGGHHRILRVLSAALPYGAGRRAAL